MSFVPIDGPIRVVPVANIPGQYLAVDRLGRFLASGTERALSQMADAFNEKPVVAGEVQDFGSFQEIKVTACPSCGYPKESEEQAKCLTCLNPPLPTVEEEVEQKKVEQSEWF